MENISVLHRNIQLNNLNIYYQEAGQGEPILLLHGWPTSSFIWRKVIKPLSEAGRVIAPDLPGFGRSDKPLDAPYTLDYYVQILDQFINKLDLKQINLVVHDLGGPIGLLWAVRNLIKVKRIVIMNTFVYPDFSFSLKLFSLIAKVPLLRNWLVSPLGLALMMKGGVANKKIMTKEVIADYQTPFVSVKDRQVLLKVVNRMEPDKLKEIADKLPQFTLPVLIMYGEKDFMLAPIMRRLKRDIPNAFFAPIADCHHFLLEEKADDINRHILEFIKNGKNRLICNIKVS